MPKPRGRKPHQAPMFELLERRLLLSAAAVPYDLAACDDNYDPLGQDQSACEMADWNGNEQPLGRHSRAGAAREHRRTGLGRLWEGHPGLPSRRGC